jgi:hypothetical protein
MALCKNACFYMECDKYLLKYFKKAIPKALKFSYNVMRRGIAL